MRRICHQQPSRLHPAALLCPLLVTAGLNYSIRVLLGSYISKETLSLSCLKRHPSRIFLQRMGLPGDLVHNGSGLLSFQRQISAFLFHPTGFLISQVLFRVKTEFLHTNCLACFSKCDSALSSLSACGQAKRKQGLWPHVRHICQQIPQKRRPSS